MDAFASHRTQGVSVFLGSPFFRRPIALKREDGGQFDEAALARPLSELLGTSQSAMCNAHRDWCEKLVEADREVSEARTRGLQLDWTGAVDLLAKAEATVSSLRVPNAMSSYGPLGKENEGKIFAAACHISLAARKASGFQFVAEANRGTLIAGEPVQVTVKYGCRPGVKCWIQENSLESFSFSGLKSQDRGTGDPPLGIKFLTIAAPVSFPEEVWPRRQTEKEPAASASLYFGSDSQRLTEVTVPVTYTQATSTQVDRVPVRIVPAYTLAVEPKQEIEKLAGKHEPFDVFLRVHSYSQKTATVKVGLDVPAGWKSSDAVDVNFAGEGDRYAKITATPPAKLEAGHYTITAYAKRGEEKFTTSIEPLPSMPTLVWEEPAQTVVHAFDIKAQENLRVGYISAESEPVPDALKMLGISVEMLDANALNFGDLSKYNAIVVGVRAYELRSELPGANQRLLDYAKNGGTLVVQYQRDFAWDGKNYAPYPAKIGQKQGDPLPRITDETSPVKFLKPDDALLNTPNKITQEDFKGWVQERGLYFWSEFDPQYTALLAMNDPGEKDLNGALVYTKYGKGTYIYTGVAFFRQLPEGVPGAYRLFVNLLAASRTH
jgi:hypothetical protein